MLKEAKTQGSEKKMMAAKDIDKQNVYTVWRDSTKNRRRNMPEIQCEANNKIIAELGLKVASRIKLRENREVTEKLAAEIPLLRYV